MIKKILIYLWGLIFCLFIQMVLNRSVEMDEFILPEHLKVEAERERQKIEEQGLKAKLLKIKQKYNYLDNQFEFKQLEDKFFEKLENIRNRDL